MDENDFEVPTRAAVLKYYKVDRNGYIRSPGKFEGERVYVPYFWDKALEGWYDWEEDDIVGFKVAPEDRLEFPELGAKDEVRLAQTDDGFVTEVTLRNSGV